MGHWPVMPVRMVPWRETTSAGVCGPLVKVGRVELVVCRLALVSVVGHGVNRKGGVGGLWVMSGNWVHPEWWFARKATCYPVVLKYARLFDPCVWRRMALPLKELTGRLWDTL